MSLTHIGTLQIYLYIFTHQGVLVSLNVARGSVERVMTGIQKEIVINTPNKSRTLH